MVDEPWPAQLNKVVWEKRHQPPGKAKPLVVSIGQVVPHEVMGMANFNKNLFVGVGGVEAINLSHFIGAVHGMEKVRYYRNGNQTMIECTLSLSPLWFIHGGCRCVVLICLA